MSTLDELRRTLDEHAEGIHDPGVHHRAADVRRRGRQVRRQRRIGVGVAAAAVVATATVITALPHGDSPSPADRSLLGMTAPATMTSLGYTYDFTSGVTGDGQSTTVKVAASDTARLLTWADRGEGAIRVRTEDHRTIVSRGDFDDFLVIPPGFGGTWTIVGADTAAAIYEVDASQPPDGFTRGGITFRADVLDRTLLDSAISEAGQSDLQGSVSLPAGRSGVAGFCTGGTNKTWIHFKVSHGVEFFGRNCSAPVFDPGGSLDSDFRTRTGETRVHVWATEGEHGPRSTAPDLRLGYGFYSLSQDSLPVAGYRLEQQIEYDGHVWGMPRSIESRPGDRSLSWRVPDRGASVVVASFSHTGGPVYTSLAGKPGAAYAGTGLGGAGTLGVAYPDGPSSGLRIHGTVSPRALLGLTFYVRLD